MEARLWFAAALCTLAAIALGAAVAFRPPGLLDADGAALRGHAITLALFFTRLGRWPFLLGLGVIAFGIAMTLRTGERAVVTLLATQTLSQAANSLIKFAYHRPRPAAVLGVADKESSYPSGHAVTTIVFFGGLAVLIARSPLPLAVKVPLLTLAAICVGGIPWSRLALGAHYVTDVCGGLLLGTAWLCAALAFLVHLRAAAGADR